MLSTDFTATFTRGRISVLFICTFTVFVSVLQTVLKTKGHDICNFFFK